VSFREGMYINNHFTDRLSYFQLYNNNIKGHKHTICNILGYLCNVLQYVSLKCCFVISFIFDLFILNQFCFLSFENSLNALNDTYRILFMLT